MRTPPRLDAHAHLAEDIDAQAIRGLGAHVFAVTRSVAEFNAVAKRNDIRTVWGVGSHPGLVRVNKAFDRDAFREALDATPLVGEVGLDGTSRVSMAAQISVLRSVLEELQQKPRLVSVHSSRAHFQVLRELHRTPVDGVILHWWTGSAELTEEAVRLGCYFSLPPAMMSSVEVLKRLPINRVLPETDHPYGDRFTPGTKRPGGIDEVEKRLALLYGRTPRDIRIQFWRNLHSLMEDVGVAGRFGQEWTDVLDRLD